MNPKTAPILPKRMGADSMQKVKSPEESVVFRPWNRKKRREFIPSLSVFGNIQGTLVNRPSFEEVSYGGKNITAYYPQDTMVDITGNVSVTGTMTENGFLVSGNTYIAPNSVIRVSGKYVDIEIKVLSLKKIEPN